MKYETPELTALTPAINAIQSTTDKKATGPFDSTSREYNEANGAYADWE
jgi:hypothetical protein